MIAFNFLPKIKLSQLLDI